MKEYLHLIHLASNHDNYKEMAFVAFYSLWRFVVVQDPSFPTVFPNSRTGCSRVPPQSATLTPQHCCIGDPVRLACLIHATSVRSEPESNSQKKNLRMLHTNIYCSVSLSKTHLKLQVSKSDFPPSLLRARRDTSTHQGERVQSISKRVHGRKGVILKNRSDAAGSFSGSRGSCGAGRTATSPEAGPGRLSPWRNRCFRHGRRARHSSRSRRSELGRIRRTERWIRTRRRHALRPRGQASGYPRTRPWASTRHSRRTRASRAR